MVIKRAASSRPFYFANDVNVIELNTMKAKTVCYVGCLRWAVMLMQECHWKRRVLAGGGLEVERRSSGNFINAFFYPAKMDLFKQSRTIDLLLTRLKEREMDLSPDFKRRANLWNEGGKNGRSASVLALTAGLGSCQAR